MTNAYVCTAFLPFSARRQAAAMKLLTHNMLTCSKKTCNQVSVLLLYMWILTLLKAGSTAFPLRIKAAAVEKAGTEFNSDFLVLNRFPCRFVC